MAEAPRVKGRCPRWPNFWDDLAPVGGVLVTHKHPESNDDVSDCRPAGDPLVLAAGGSTDQTLPTREGIGGTLLFCSVCTVVFEIPGSGWPTGTAMPRHGFNGASELYSPCDGAGEAPRAVESVEIADWPIRRRQLEEEREARRQQLREERDARRRRLGIYGVVAASLLIAWVVAARIDSSYGLWSAEPRAARAACEDWSYSRSRSPQENVEAMDDIISAHGADDQVTHNLMKERCPVVETRYSVFVARWRAEMDPPRSQESPSDEEIGTMSFSLLLRSEYPGEFGHASNRELADVGRAICADFDAGMSVLEIALSMTPDVSPEAAAFAVGAAGPAFCDHNTEDMVAQFRSMG